jgi:hypothetical protein
VTALEVDFCGERRRLGPGDELTFGRAADLAVDEANAYLHRIVGRFVWHAGFWWVENLGAHIELELLAADVTAVRLGPRPVDGDPLAAPLTSGDARLRFAAGGLQYELDVLVGPIDRPVPAPLDDGDGAATSRYGHLELTADERLLLSELARPVLADASAGPDSLPANREVALRLGWTLTKFNRKLDYLCTRLTKVGVRGLQGGRGEEATNRRWRLVEHAVTARLVTPADLEPDAG